LNGLLLFADYLASVPPSMTRLTARIRKYPRDFQKVHFPSGDGVRLTGWFGKSPVPGPRPGLILLPGLFTSKDNNRIRARSVRILREWGFHILTLDLRGIGESERVRSSPGTKEADDIIAAVRWFEANADVKPLHLYAESLAAAAALVAAGREGKQGRSLLDGRILSVSPFADPKPVVERFSGIVDWKDRAFGPTKAFFKIILRLSGTGETEFTDYVRNGAQHYGVDLDEFYAQSSALAHAAHIRDATTVLHSTDDVIVPVEDTHRLAAAANGNASLRTLVLPWGNHCLYEMADAKWYWKTLGIYFGAEKP
jgi:dipeptidyl aminopeptidase/acylaminoacyl peptidase